MSTTANGITSSQHEREVVVRALQDIAGSRPLSSDARLLRKRARDALDSIGVAYRRDTMPSRALSSRRV